MLDSGPVDVVGRSAKTTTQVRFRDATPSVASFDAVYPVGERLVDELIISSLEHGRNGHQLIGPLTAKPAAVRFDKKPGLTVTVQPFLVLNADVGKEVINP